MLASTLAIAAALQSAPAQVVDEPDTITVVGRAALPETPASVAVIDDETLRAQALVGLPGALSLIPGVQIVETGPLGNQASLFIRGTDSDHTLATLDGIRLNSPANPNGAFSFGSDLLTENLAVEVLRGPASATYGSDAIGGVVNLAPSAASGGSVSASVGELDTYTGSANAGGAAGALTYSVGAAFARSDGWDALPGRIVPEERVGERDGSEAFMVNADLDYAASEAVTLSLTGLYREADAEFDTFSGGPTGFQRADDDDLRSEDSLSVARAGVTYAPGDWSVTANLGLVEGTFTERNGDAVTGDVQGTRVFGELLGRYDTGALTATAGLIVEDETADIPVSFNDPLDVSETHAGGFVFGQYQASETLTVTGALRLDDYEAFGTAATWNAGAAYRTGGLRLRANAGTAFNAPSLSERFSVSAFNAGNPDLREEDASAIEVAAAYNWAAGPGAVTTEVVLFRTDTDNLIEFDFAQGRNINVGDARAQGAELSVRWEGAALSAFAAYTYTDAENRNTGTALLRRPEHGFTANAAWAATEKLSLSARYVRTGERPDVLYDDQGFFGGTGTTDAFGLVAATARYAVSDALSAFVTATNLTDETYEQPASFGGAPRQVRAGVRYGW